MRKEVLVTVRGTQTNDLGERETIELVTKANYYQKNSSYYIVYNESEISGMAGTTTSLKAEPSRVTLNRMGTAEVKQVFEEGIHHESNYVTPYGAMWVRVLPWKVEVDLTEVGGSINLEYELEMCREKIGYNELSITVQEV
ncbi:DUF1934 family protein [Desulfofundulus thermobenzoicus]|uniref:DUF1934 family protein n=1 Tax=Desulfofundulus thermobenzoicus TaxID=29376 RepID=A0A6N7ISQ9_9FIRM|nr:DUF1934 domain-containing protein [Desulfofundulus thermobenzoicus]MQL53092.1 DUF1934 family protein [Desulfofundulus thermobenzoicus]HHW42586.1 DUF1934 family protein [Desulfotomaculum sp.]